MFRLSRKNIGDQSETIAKQYLEQQGLTYITSNFRCRRGEIDLIMKDQYQLVFIEVRYRSQNNYGTAADTITRKKQKKVILAAHYYLHKYQLTERVSCRFDTVTVQAFPQMPNTGVVGDKKYEIQWLQDAFNTD